jgi:hypothetical protein
VKGVEEAARRLEGEKVDLIVAMTSSVTLAAKRATKSIPEWWRSTARTATAPLPSSP